MLHILSIGVSKASKSANIADLPGLKLDRQDGWSNVIYSPNPRESTCQHAGVNGLRGAWRRNQKLLADMCVSPSVGLPLAVTLHVEDGSSTTAMQLAEFRP